MFNSRPDKMRAQERQIESLVRTNTTLTNELQFHLNQKIALEEDAPAEYTYEELCDLAECAQDKAEKALKLQVKLKSKKIRERFKAKGLFPLYCLLVNLQDAYVCQCNKDLAECNYQLWCLASDGSEECISEATAQICDILNSTEVTDWSCKDMIEDVAGKLIEETGTTIK